MHAIGAQVFDLDAATNAHATVPCQIAYDNSSAELDGLEQPWEGNTWCNFPFSQPPPWIEKALREAYRCRSITLLGPMDPSTDWNQLITRACDAFAVWPRREHFSLPNEDEEGRLPNGRKRSKSPPGAIALYYIGPQSNAWMRIMRDDYSCAVYHGRIDGLRPIVLKAPKRPRRLEDL